MARRRATPAILVASVLILGACSSVDQPDGGKGAAGGIEPGPVAGKQDLYGPAPENASKGGKLTVASLTEPPSLDPYHQAADSRIQYTSLMYQGLMFESAAGGAIPLLAEDMNVSEDGLTYTFPLREGVTFHDGSKMTSEDVKYSYDYIRDAKNGSPGAGDFQSIEKISAPDPGTVEFQLSEPNAALPMTLTNKYGGVVPSGYFDDPDAKKQLNEESVGTGPYQLKELKKNSSLTLRRNQDYWDDAAPYLDELVFQFMPTSAAIVVALQNGRVDMASLPRIQDARQLQGEKDIKLEEFPSLNQKALDLDSNMKPLDDVRVRRAIASALDKREIAQAAAPDQHQVLGTMVDGMQEQWGLPIDEVPYQNTDVKGAKKLLKAAGHPNGFEIKLTIINGYDWMDPAAVAITQQLKKVGITVKTSKVELGTWIENFQSGNMGFTLNDWGTQPDPSLLFYRHFHAKPEGSDFRNWKNDKASELLDKGIATAEMGDRAAIYRDFQKEMANTVPTYMIYSPNYVVAMNKRVRNYVQHPTGWYFGLAQTHVAS